MELDELIVNLENLEEHLHEVSKELKKIENLKEEVRMWRERYLCSLEKEENPEKGAKLWCIFLSISNDDMTSLTPEKIIRHARASIRAG